MFRKYWWTPLVLLLLILVGLAFYWEFGRTPTFESNSRAVDQMLDARPWLKSWVQDQHITKPFEKAPGFSRGDESKIVLDNGVDICYPSDNGLQA